MISLYAWNLHWLKYFMHLVILVSRISMQSVEKAQNQNVTLTVKRSHFLCSFQSLCVKCSFVFRLVIRLLNIQDLCAHISHYVKTHGILSSANWESWNYIHLYCLKVWSYWNQSKVWNLCFLLSIKEVLTFGCQDYSWVTPIFFFFFSLTAIATQLRQEAASDRTTLGFLMLKVEEKVIDFSFSI